MRSLPIYLAVLVAVVLMGLGFQQPRASEVADNEISKLNAAAPKFPRKPLLPADVKLIHDAGHGSATHVGGGKFLTAAHVAKESKNTLNLKLKDGSIRKGELLWVSEQYDVALVQASGDGLESVKISCVVPPIGTDFTMVGNPRNFEHVTTFGRVAADELSWLHWKSLIVISAPSIPGQSGGGIYNSQRELIGLFVGLQIMGGTPFYVVPTGYGVAVPGKTICQLLARV
jgi:S1-C subfamily serine protease